MAVKTSVGMTKRVNMPNIVQQGGTWGPMLCSNSIDTIGKKCMKRNEHCYLYKNTARILPLAFVEDLNGIARCGFDSIALNTFLTTQIELKKLRFHVADVKGKSKCVKMHVGKKHDFCPTLKVHGTIMPEVTEETYLGDLLTSDGKNTKNIKCRVSKGIGIISQIMNLLEKISFGPHLFEIAMLLRDSMLINGTINNAEIWYNLTETEVQEFENIDNLFFRRLLEVPKSAPIEAYFLELGAIPIGVIIKARRVNYLHSVLSREKTSMLYTFFISQWNNPYKGDWTELVQRDLEDLNIPCSFEYILSKSKEAFKRLVKVKAKEFALEKLTRKKNTHSKMEKLDYNEIKMQNYLLSEQLKPKQKRLIFKYRTRMAEFGENYRGGRSQVMCPLCETHLDNQELSYQCLEIRSKLKIMGKIEDIFKEEISLETAETIEKITELRRSWLEK